MVIMWNDQPTQPVLIFDESPYPHPTNYILQAMKAASIAVYLNLMILSC